MTKAKKCRELLYSPRLEFLCEAHNALQISRGLYCGFVIGVVYSMYCSDEGGIAVDVGPGRNAGNLAR